MTSQEAANRGRHWIVDRLETTIPVQVVTGFSGFLFLCTVFAHF